MSKEKIQLWFYKADGNFYDKLIRFVNRTEYSHVELCIDGYCYSSSPRDGGVRRKQIVFSEHWDKIELEVTEQHKQSILMLFEQEQGSAYDWLGAVKTTVRFFPNHKDKWFCSEIIAQALGLKFARRFTPADLFDYFSKQENKEALLYKT